MRGGTSDRRPNNLETFFCGRLLDLYTELDGHGHNYHVFLFYSKKIALFELLTR